MQSASQRLRQNSKSNTANSALVCPITPSEFSNFMGLDYDASDDALLNAHLLAACTHYISLTSNELLTRSWTFKLDSYPATMDSFGGLSRISASLDPWIEIPLRPVSSITGITIDGSTVTFDADLDSKPPRVFTDDVGDNISINYIAGYATAEEIPATAILGINLLASYLFEHRGACKINDAINDSGAAMAWGVDAMILNL